MTSRQLVLISDVPNMVNAEYCLAATLVAVVIAQAVGSGSTCIGCTHPGSTDDAQAGQISFASAT
jgi:hypothetical protein